MILLWVGWILLVVISFSFITDCALNLMGCGDRYEDKHRFGNWCGIVLGVVCAFAAYEFTPW